MNKGIVFSSLLLVLLVSCHVSKNVPAGEYLLKGVDITLTKESGKVTSSDLSSLIRQQPNQRVLKIPFRLMIYNAIDSSKIKDKRTRKNAKLSNKNRKRIQKMERINQKRIEKARAKGQEYYSQKIILLEDTLNPRRFFKEWLKEKYGEAPVVFDSTLFAISKDQLRIYLKKKGYYESTVNYKLLKNEKKRTLAVEFQVNAGNPLIIDSLTFKGSDGLVNFLKAYLEDEVKRTSDHPLVGKELDEDLLSAQAEGVAKFIRNFGLYGFTSDNLRFIVDSNASTHKAQLTVEFLPRKIVHEEKKDSIYTIPFVKYTVKRVFFHLSDSNSLEIPFVQYAANHGSSNEGGLVERGFLETYESTVYKKIKCDKNAAKRFKLSRQDFNPYRIVDVYFNGNLPGVKPHILELQNYLEPTNVYKDKYLERSYQFLSQLNLFSAIKPVLTENIKDKTVDIHYFLVRSKLQSFAFEPKFTSSFGLLGVNASINYNHKNLLRGGERLSISLGGGFDSQPVVFDDPSAKGRTFNTFEFGPSFKLEVPGLFPVPSWKLSKRQKPSTVFNVAANIEHRDIFDRSVLQFSYTWKWQVAKTQVFTVGLPFMSTVKFVRFKNSPDFQNQIDALNDLFLRNSYSNQLIWEDFKFQFEWSNISKDFRADDGHSERKSLADLRFISNLSLAGNVLHRLNNNSDTLYGGIQTFFGNAFAQFMRMDNQFTMIKRFKSKLQLAAKASAGVGIPYGNSKTSMPYDYSFFGGGSNDNRGWKARSLGPGSYKSYLDSTGTATQLGDIRFYGSLEFRFPLGRTLSSCVFADVGNIWTYRKDENRKGAEFTSDFYKQLALSIGTGVRIDLSILVVRLDVGFPLYNPALPDKARWIFQDRVPYYEEGKTYYGFNTGNAQADLDKAKERLPKPFVPSLNFGIGLPF